MKRRALIWSAAPWAFLIAVLAAAFVYNLSQPDVTTCTSHYKEVMVAAVEIQPGTPRSPSMITSRFLPERFLPPNPIRMAEADIYLGTTVGWRIEPGEVILSSDFTVSDRTRTHPMCGGIPLHLEGVRRSASDERVVLGRHVRNMLCGSSEWTMKVERIER